MSALRLSGEQERVVRHEAAHQVVLAGAGTGKTETLTRRILHLLLEEDGCELHQIIALTFTDKAAGEMRQRVYQGILSRLKNCRDQEQRARLEQLRSDFPDLRIGTFDGFNRRLLSLYPEQALLVADVPPGFEPLSDADERELQTELQARFWAYCEALEGQARRELFEMLHFYERASLTLLISQLARENEATLKALKCETEPEELKRQLQALTLEAQTRFARRTSRESERHWRAYIALLPRDISPQLFALLSDQDALHPDGSTVLTKAGTWRKEFLKKHEAQECERVQIKAFEPLKRWRGALEKGRELNQSLLVTPASLEVEAESRARLRRLAPLALWWKREHARECARLRRLDFDAAARAVRVLLDEPEVARRVRQGCLHVLIDEFQDTNIEQWRLIEALQSSSVMVVGDEKQAIFGFRGGDITVFNQVQQQLIGQSEPAALLISRRSTPSIIAWCNRLFQSLLPDLDTREEFEAPFQALSAAPESATNEIGVRVLRVEEVEDERAALAQATALLLRELQDDADDGSFARRPELRGIAEKLARGEAGTIGVLFRTHARKAIFEAALSDVGVRFASVKGTGFYQSEAARDALNLASFLHDAEDSLALVGLLRSPFCGLSDLALLELRTDAKKPLYQALWEADGDTSRFSGADARAISLSVARLKLWRERAPFDGLSGVLERVLRESEVVFFESGLPDAAQRRENWGKLIDEIRGRETSGRGAMRELAAYLRAQEAEEEQEADAALPETGAIQLMTVYAAKGLGFEMTIVAQADDVPRHSSSLLSRGAFPTRDDIRLCLQIEVESEDGTMEKREPPTWTILKEEARARSEAEFRRLLYVACTRAKEQLLLVVPREFKPGSWADLWSPFVEDLPVVVPCASEHKAVAPTLAPIDLSLLRSLPPNARREIEMPAPHQLLHQIERELGLPPDARSPEVAACLAQLQSNGDSARFGVEFSLPASRLRADLSDWPADWDGARWIHGTLDVLLPREDGWLLGVLDGDETRAQISVAAAKLLGLKIVEMRVVNVDEAAETVSTA